MGARHAVVVGVLSLASAFVGWAGGQVQPSGEVNAPALFVVGDSTAGNGPDLGWGSHLGKYFDPSKIRVVNRAHAGRSSRTFLTEGLWDQVADQLKPGDFVLIQFGHNDGGPVNDDKRARGSLPGLGEETQSIHNRVTDARAKGAVAIVCSPIPRNNWNDARVSRASDSYGKWAAEAARAEDAAFIDLNEIIARQYERMGQTKVTGICFPPGERTHTSAAGARINAACVVEGLEALGDCPLVRYLRDAQP